MKKFILSTFIILMSSILYAGSRDPNTSDHKYLEYGSKFTCVGIVTGTYSDKQIFVASGVAIDDHHILTAAHVVQGTDSCYFITHSGTKLCLNKIIYHKDFNRDILGKYDIAIGYSEEKINLDFYPELYTELDEVGKVCSISGYGNSGTFLTGARFSDHKKRAGSNIIDYIDRDLLVCTPSEPSAKNRTELEFIIAPGDSGGGLFIDGKLAGINSCVMAIDKKTDSSYTDEGGHTRISKYVDWILANKSR